jgi:hypothetical protein
MRYVKGMQRYSKAGDSYQEDEVGSFYKGGDGKMYKMAKGRPPAPKGMDKEGNKPGQADDHAHSHPDDDSDYPGSKEKGGAKAKKSMASALSEEDLSKTLDELEDLVKAEDPEERRKQLLQKAQEGDLTDDENEELLKSLRGGDAVADDDPALSESLTKGFSENTELQEQLDVSPYLEEQHAELVKSLSALGEVIEQSDRRQHNFNLLLAKATHQTGTLLKAMSERLGVIEAQPARGPKSRGIRQNQGALEKSFGDAQGGAPASGAPQLSRDEALDVMTEMMKSFNGTAPCGEDINLATAKYEQTGQMSKGMRDDILQFNKEHAH